MEDNHNGHLQEQNAASAAAHNETQPEGQNTSGTARILAKAGEAFDSVEAGRALHEVGLKDPAKLEPTDQSFIFADPREGHATFIGNDNALHSADADETLRPASTLKPFGEEMPMSPPALDLTEAPDPDIPWRARPMAPGVNPLPTGVLQEGETHTCPRGIYDTDPRLFGPDDSWLIGGEDEEGNATELVLGLKFREYGSVYFFRAGKEKIKAGGKVLVDTENGLSLAEVISARKMRLPLPKIRTAEGDEVEITSIKGLAGPEDIAAAADNRILSTGAGLFCKQCIRERNLDMKLVDVEVLHDRSKIIFYFTAPSRIDFRDLVKDLVRNYRTRIELRQIGVRHETQMLGALGNCGMSCCCRRFLRRFAPVTIKMAKEQNLFLNPAKLSGICGRLLCCLANEQENYEEFHRNCPKIGKRYQTTSGVMKVLRANLFRQSIMAVDDFGNEEEFQLDSWHSLAPQRLESREPQKEPREGRGERQHCADGPVGSQAAGSESSEILPEAGASEKDLAVLVDNDLAGEAQVEARGRGEGPDRQQRDKRQGRNRGKRGGQERPQRGGQTERAQGDVARLKSVIQGDEHDSGGGSGQCEDSGKKGGEDNSIFGLPGLKFKK